MLVGVPNARFLVVLGYVVIGVLAGPGGASAEPPRNADCVDPSTPTPWGQLRLLGWYGNDFRYTEVCVDERKGTSDRDRSRIGVHFHFEGLDDNAGRGPRKFVSCALTVKVAFTRRSGDAETKETSLGQACEPISQFYEPTPRPGITASVDRSVQLPAGWDLCKTTVTIRQSTKCDWSILGFTVHDRDHLPDEGNGVSWTGCSDFFSGGHYDGVRDPGVPV
jgi:hypothetical protein